MTSPAFQFYVQDFLTGTIHMSAEETGAYILLLCHQWDKGALPDNDKELLRIARTRIKVLEAVKLKFVRGEDGMLRNARMEKERQKQALWRSKSSDAGKKSGEIRRNKMKDASGLVQTKYEPNADSSSSSSSSFSSSFSSSEKDIAAAEPKKFLKEKNPVELANIERTIPPEEWEHCLSQWNLSLLSDPHWQRTGDDSRDIRALLARLRKWCATWSYNLSKQQKQQQQHSPPRQQNLDRIGDAADQVLAAIGSRIGAEASPR